MLGMKGEDITIHQTRIGGGFGRRLLNDYMVMVGQVAKAMPGKPVKILFDRTDDLRNDYYRPAGWHRFTAGLDARAIWWRSATISSALARMGNRSARRK
jgi:isoquinoline 1-oxidoreductase beta subunit